MYQIRYTRQFEKDIRSCKQKGLSLDVLWDVVELLAEDGTLPDSFRPHLLQDEYAGCWECHIDDNWLLIWRQDNYQLTLLLTNTGTHEELFHPTAD